MKKQNLLNYLNDELLDKLYGFCYTRTSDGYQAEELCSDIVFALVKAARADGEIENVYPFIWKTARNVYADFSARRRKEADMRGNKDTEDVYADATAPSDDDTDEMLTAVYRRIAFLTKAYREAMVSFYLEGLSAKQIAEKQHTSETNVRQRLFSARQIIKKEVEKMTETCNKPVSLDKVEFVIWGTGNPAWGDPREGFTRQLSKQIVWLCMKKPMTATELAEEMNVPTVYVEEELEMLRRGENGEYGFLRRLENGKYALNVVLLDKDTVEKIQSAYIGQIPKICDVIIKFIDEHRQEYLSYPYLNKKIDMNLIIWQQIFPMAHALQENVEEILGVKYFAGQNEPKRPFSVFGYVDTDKHYGGGWDGIEASNVCGYKTVRADNIYPTRLEAHFHCGHNVSNDHQLQLALRSVDGLDIKALNGKEKEYAAKAVECGYLYREGDKLYTKILVSRLKDADGLFSLSNSLNRGYFEKEAEEIARKLAVLFEKAIPSYLYNEWSYANIIANAPVLDAVIGYLIEKGIITAPENGIGAEGCWMTVEK
ncbi:MAG: sigma-70 family RNA polymerase sigma factor [Clostridia bacterium]|nr:sigma-70 family RNA polymerase sigma factor [Clostridia bacterium]